MIKTATVGLLLNMLVSTPLPAFAEEGTTTTIQAGTATQTTQKAVKIPSVESLGLNLKSAVLIEPTTGEILLSMNADEALPPASMTKMMTEYLVAEAVKTGQISWDQKVIVGENASKQVGSRIFLAEKDEHTVEELYIAMAVGSANDATVALAELVSGSELEFVELMNQTAQKMGMKTAYFVNSTGLDKADMPKKYRSTDKKENVMSAMDAAILAKYIVTDHPDFNRFTTVQSYKFRERDTAPMINFNWMLESNKNIQNFKAYAYEGLDGLKTGHTARAKYCFAGTAERDGMRLISVVMGANTEPHRFTETKKVLDFGFNNFEIKQVVAPKAVLAGNETVPVLKGKNKKVSVVTDEAVSFIVPKGTTSPQIKTTVEINDPATLVAPIEQSAKVGKVTYSYQVEGMSDVQQKTVNLITAEEAEKAGWFSLFLRAIGDFFGDLFTGIKNLF
ncbi:D-alanyl-D-alanine carboxypeptidase [Paenibacillus sp. VTT E-133280]|jgi:D-alanyl-D-alanine carboxypeptidase (penicillin-binding protein 5/6)|uniref:D-alanyl-D-alanine carboxypeptidase family protein n=1 Tax=Paenibacillus TaxID=44249 RepID=UPI000BA14394|nr:MULTISPECIES: D-alanyl-D-alanine carboxypeptidase family protein [unclassified Paenibacillus]OZQ62072.1 D-alanyl-D-alanine carboxypeptidase [Paenibacillus sp. VTT E-133280]OZQ85367.1 D-alanyl-D-alanine carboxypeptidase [Paenibacillus sp. VTT E-133291]